MEEGGRDAGHADVSGRLLSRLLRRFPFLVEAWYWALIYWVRALFPVPQTISEALVFPRARLLLLPTSH